MRNLYVLSGWMLAWVMYCLAHDNGWGMGFWFVLGLWIYVEAYRMEKRR